MIPKYIKLYNRVWFDGIGEACTIIYIDDNHIDDIDCYWAGVFDDGNTIITSFKDTYFWLDNKRIK